jgi:hypothetical protein
VRPHGGLTAIEVALDDGDLLEVACEHGGGAKTGDPAAEHQGAAARLRD